MGQNGTNGATPVTQLQHARAGVVTDAMRRVAEKEELPAELVRDEVARGRMIIPANVNHLAMHLDPIGIGKKCTVKINANIGNSAVTSEHRRGAGEAALRRPLRRRHRDGPLDRRRHRRIREAIIENSTVPVGTVPIYQAVQQVKASRT